MSFVPTGGYPPIIKKITNEQPTSNTNKSYGKFTNIGDILKQIKNKKT